MIECDVCQQWFHCACAGIEEEKAADIDIYHYPDCEFLHGPSIMRKQHGSPKEHKALKEPVKTGSPIFTHYLLALKMAFQAWSRKEVLPDHEGEIPKTVHTTQLIEDVDREICLVEDIFQHNFKKMNNIFELQQLSPDNSPFLTSPNNSMSVSKLTLSLPFKSSSQKKDPKHKNIFKNTEHKGRENTVLWSDGQHNYNLMDLNHQVQKVGSSQKVEFNITSTCLHDLDDDSKPDQVFDGNESPVALLKANGKSKRVKNFSKSCRAKIIKKEDNSRLVEEQTMGDEFDLNSNDEIQNSIKV
ncbi:hypothetical protein STEG23_014309 [Scotinomys teguina]